MNNTSIRRNLALNGVALSVQKLLIAGRQLILVPFFIAAWGPRGYGEWLTLSAIPSAMTIGNLGLGTAAANSFVIAHAQGDLDTASRAMRSGLLLLGIVVILTFIISATTLAVFYTHPTFASIDHFRSPAVISGILLGFEALIGFFFPLNEAWFRAARKAHLATNLQSVTTIAAIVLTVIALAMRKNMTYVATIQCTCTLFSVGYLYFRGHRLIPEIANHKTKLKLVEIRSFFLKGLAYMMSPIRQAISLQGTLFVTRFILGAEAVALLGTMRTLANSNLQIFNGINATIFPELQVALASNRLADARKLHQFGISLSALIALIGCTFILTAGPWMYRHWTRETLQPSGSLWLILISIIICNALWWVPAAVFRATNRPEQIGFIGILAAISGLGCSWAMTPSFGVPGALLGVLAMELMMAAYILPSSCRILCQSPADLPMHIWHLRGEILDIVQRKLAMRSGRTTTPHSGAPPVTNDPM